MSNRSVFWIIVFLAIIAGYVEFYKEELYTCTTDTECYVECLTKKDHPCE